MKIICKKFFSSKNTLYLCIVLGTQTKILTKKTFLPCNITSQKQKQHLTQPTPTHQTLLYHAVTIPAKKPKRFWIPCRLIATFVLFNTTQTKCQRKDLNNHLAFNTFLVQVTPKVTVTCTFPFLLWI